MSDNRDRNEGALPATVAPFSMRLERASDGDFEWLEGNAAGRQGLTLAPDLAPPGVVAIVRTMPANWLMIVGDEVVGLIGVKDYALDGCSAEIGYGTAASRRGLGYARQAVGLLADELAQHGIAEIRAETSVDNPASQRVLAGSGFEEIGRRVDDEDGPLICWRLRPGVRQT